MTETISGIIFFRKISATAQVVQAGLNNAPVHDLDIILDGTIRNANTAINDVFHIFNVRSYAGDTLTKSISILSVIISLNLQISAQVHNSNAIHNNELARRRDHADLMEQMRRLRENWQVCLPAVY